MKSKIDATALRRGDSRLSLRRELKEIEDATALRRGDSRLSLRRELKQIEDATALSRGGPRELLQHPLTLGPIAANVKLYGASQWQLGRFYGFLIATSVSRHGARPWHLCCDLSNLRNLHDSRSASKPDKANLRKVGKGAWRQPSPLLSQLTVSFQRLGITTLGLGPYPDYYKSRFWRLQQVKA